MPALFGAIDLGASSGRVIAGNFANDKITLEEIHRFPNSAKSSGDRLHWDFENLLREVKVGLRKLAGFASLRGETVVSLGIDSWAVDYGLLRDEILIKNPNCYRDPINQYGVEQVHQLIPFERLYEITGLQFLQFNTIYQLEREEKLKEVAFDEVTNILLLPDLIGFHLTGVKATERTNASTTGLLDATTREWSREIVEKLNIPIEKFPALRDAGEVLGELKEEFGPSLSKSKIVLVGSHDTASAVAGVPAAEEEFAYLSCGTWSLLGVELDGPVLSEESREANFTNELGVMGKVRFLKNLSGLWLLSECMRHWEEIGKRQNLESLLTQASGLDPLSFIDVSDPDFIAPGDMPAKIERQLQSNGFSGILKPHELVAVILHSLAKSYSENLELIRKLTGKKIEVLHIIGGGVQNQLLCQLTADYCLIEVVAGPVEATAIGNLLCQAQAAGLVGKSLEDSRRVIRNSNLQLIQYSPRKQRG